MKINIMKQGKLAASLAVAGIVTFSGIGAAFASVPSQEPSNRQGLFGNITSIGESSFTLETRGAARNSGTTRVDLIVDRETRFMGSARSSITFDELAVGSRVAVLAYAAKGDFTGRQEGQALTLIYTES